MSIASLSAWLATTKTLREMRWRARLRIILFAGPVLLSLAMLGFAIEGALYWLKSVPVEGLVVERYEWPGETFFDAGTINYEPIFSYEIDGKSYRASVGSAHASFDVPVGARATIRAIPGDRGNVRMDTWQGMWFIPAMLGLFALAAWAGALIIWFALRILFFGKERPA